MTLTLPVRYYRLSTDPGVTCSERNFHYVETALSLKTEQTALVLVDVWDMHYISNYEAEEGQITEERIKPLLEPVRRAGIAVVHAPSPRVAKHYPQWLRYAGDREIGTPQDPEPDWPPAEFRKREGEYTAFARPKEPIIDDWYEKSKAMRIHVAVAPEPDDFVIATGEQLHRLLRHRKILHLIYAGFATNMCLINRDYGIREMQRRGYNIIVVRDCTRAVETHKTVDNLVITEIEVLNLEMSCFSALGKDLIEACRTA